ncbi:MAG: isoprenyl transferase [Clostridia bacterium]|nr:isoprenyl transferase [Clostridia bacterium]
MFFGSKFGFRKRDAENQLDLGNIPKHIGVIMDGNGRWAKKRGLPRSAGHKQGAKTLEMIADYCGSIGVEVLTAYAFSTENWSRPKEEVNALMDLLYDYLSQAEQRFGEKDCRLVISGDISKFSDKIKDVMAHAMDVTKNGKKITINLALNYGGRDEIVRAVRHIGEDIKSGNLSCDDIDEELFGKYLDTNGMPEVDLIIRPSGELRLSNFLLWQAAYAEFWFSDICWPDFTPADMDAAIIDYQKRNRRFGGV